VVNTILKEADLFCPNSVRINFTIYQNNKIEVLNSFEKKWYDQFCSKKQSAYNFLSDTRHFDVDILHISKNGPVWWK
ncbi:hypothetical protein, partial [Levilactobacillus brevis]|uniref:hypothetical protein n=1 Tax=Levilactobacillus brevis TaxID=1580 RepID=UPI0025A23652